MEIIKEFLDYFLHLDDKLAILIAQYGVYIYLILFLIIFVETGLIVMPFLPGDSLLFAAGTFAAIGDLNVFLVIGLLILAAILGDTVNYWVGKSLGLKVLKWEIGKRQLVNQAYIDKTHAYFEKHGPKAIIIARFAPIIRTFAPFVAGVGTMNYSKFISYNIIGGVIWVTSLTLLGFFFGEIPFVKEHFEKFVLGIIFISVLPMIIEFFKYRFTKKNN